MKTKWRYIAIGLLLVSLVLASAVPVMAKNVVIVRPNPALDDLTDVDAESPGDGSFLVWNATSGVWVDSTGAGCLQDIVDDTTPQLGGDLDAQGYKIHNQVRPYAAKASAYTTTVDDEIIAVDTTFGAVTITLGSAACRAGQIITIKDYGGLSGTFAITIATEGAETIDGAATDTINTNRLSKQYFSSGTHWYSYSIGHNIVYGLLDQGVQSSLPMFGTPGRLYYATDTGKLWRDTGYGWGERLRAETATRLAYLAEKSHSSLTGLGANDHPQYLLVADLENPPTEDESTKAPTSEWAFDHAAAADPHAGYVLESLFNADTFLYASVDNTPVATTPANVLVALSGHTGATFDWNGQDLTNIGDATITDVLIFPDKGIGSTRLLQMGAAQDGGIYQISDRGGLMLAAADDTLVLADGDTGMAFGAHISPTGENTYILSDGSVYIKTALQLGWGNEFDFVFNNLGRLGIGITSPADPLHIRSDSSGDTIHLEEYSGGEDWQIGIDSAGNLLFENSGTTWDIRFTDYNDIAIYDGSLCVSNAGGSCPGSTDGYIYCDYVVEYTSYWDEATQGSALEEIMRHKGIISPGGVMEPDYDTFMEGIKVTGYTYPEHLEERYQATDMTEIEFYNSLTAEEQAKASACSIGTSIGGRASQNEYAIKELYLIIQAQQATIAQQQEEIKALQDDVAKIKELLGIK